MVVEKKYKISKEWLREKYWEEEKSLSEIAEQTQACMGTIHNRFKEFDIPRRSFSESQRLSKGNKTDLSDFQLRYIEGLLMGDGSISLGTSKNACQFHYDDKHKEFIQFISKKLERWGIKQTGSIFEKHSNNENPCYSYETCLYPLFLKLREKWYLNGKKRIPEDFKITPIHLKNWYIGDGHFCSRDKIPDISAYNFQKSLPLIINQLSELGIKSGLRENGYRLIIRAESRDRFFKYILSEDSRIPPCYKYKFPN